MNDNIRIWIKTYQDIDNPEADKPIELETTGVFGVINNKYVIKYKESDLTGFPDTVTCIKIWDKNAVVSRSGKYDMTLKYAEGETNLCLYPTPYGSIGASIKTFSVDYDLKDRRGWIKVDYSIDTNNEDFLKNSLNIKIEPFESKDKTE